jgi:hypothetical protein
MQVSEVLLEIITFAPYSAYLVAIDLPIPLDEPVIRILLPVKSNSDILYTPCMIKLLIYYKINHLN